MEKVILIKYGELTTKKGNRNYFVKVLTDRIHHQLKNEHVKIQKDLSRMMIFVEEKDLSNVLEKMQTIFGIHAYNIAFKIEPFKEEIMKTVQQVAEEKEFKTFKVEVKRSDKKFPISSMELAKELGGVVLKSTHDKQVDVHHPELTIHVEIREKEAFVYTNSYKGLGG